MRRWFVGLALALVAPGAFAQNVQIEPAQPLPPNVAVARIAVRPGIMPIMQQGQLLRADAVVVGRVVGLEPMDVQAPPATNQANVNYRIAVVQLSEVIHGVNKDAKMVRVGFIAAPMNGDPNAPIGNIQIQPAPGVIGRPLPGYIGYGNVALQVGQDGLFLLAKHHKEAFYTVPSYTSFVSNQNNPNFENEVRNARQLGKVLEDTKAALKSDDRQQRYLAAALMIGKYRANPMGQPTKQVPIDAAESKLILKALASSDWSVNRTSAALPTALELFNQLGIGATDGYKPTNVRSQQEMATAMQKWLDENAEKYVIKKLVADPGARTPVEGPRPGVEPGVRPLPIRKLPAIKGGKIQIQPLPAPAPLPVPVDPIELELPVQPAQPQPAPLPLRRD